MLKALHIENVAVIKRLDIEPGNGFTVLTGETGAGKSIIVDALGFILGAKPGAGLIRSGENSASVEALFADICNYNAERLDSLGISPDENGELLIRRELTSDGKSKTRINGRAVPSSLGREAAGLLVNIHGQHENQLLLRPEEHIVYLDAYADIAELLDGYSVLFKQMSKISSEIASLTLDEREKQRRIEMLRYQLEDINSVHPKRGEEEKLLEEKNKIKNLEKIVSKSRLITRALYRSDKGASASDLIRAASDAISSLSDVLPEAENYVARLDGFRYEIEDIAGAVSALSEGDYSDPDSLLDKIESRLDAIHRLKRKYGDDTDAILAFRDSAKKELDRIESSDERLKELEGEYKKIRAKTEESAAVLTEKRRASARLLEEAVEKTLSFLDMAKVRFEVRITPKELAGNGGDGVEFFIRTNVGEDSKPLAKIASGGELSRIMLALKNVLAGREHTETLIFDEVDSGISGKTSQKIGIKLKQTALDAQVICVTHSAQIAALADEHYLVQKKIENERTVTRALLLSRDERIAELARIMGGEAITEKLLASAEELLDESKTDNN